MEFFKLYYCNMFDYNVSSVLLIGLFHTARSSEENNKINLFMRYRVAIQFVTLTILTIALFLKS